MSRSRNLNNVDRRLLLTTLAGATEVDFGSASAYAFTVRSFVSNSATQIVLNGPYVTDPGTVAGTHPGAGMPGVLSSAKVVDRLIADFEGTSIPRS